MSYRMLVGAGVAVGMTAATAMAQLPQQHQQQRPGSSQAQQLLKDLEGSWDVNVQIWSLQDAQRETRPGQEPGTRPGQTRPGQEPGTRPGETRPGQEPGTRPGQTPGQQPNVQRIQQQIQQAMTQAGVSQQEAQQHAQRVAQQIVQQRPQQQQIQQQLVQAMTQAGVEQQQAQQQAQRLSQQIHQQLQQDRPGIRPDEDDTTQPFLRPDQDRQQRTQQTQEYGEPTLRAEGSSKRQWVLDENILEEKVDFSMATEAPQDRPGGMRQFGAQRDRVVDMLKDGETLEGHGMFGFDEESGHLYHVWADSSKGTIFFSVGEYDAQQKTVTFHTADAREIMNGTQRPGQPGIRPGEPRQSEPGIRPGQPRTTPGRDPGEQPGASLINLQQPGQPGQPGQQRPGQRPGQIEQPEKSTDAMKDKARVVLRIVDNDEHVVEYYRADNPTGNAVRTMVITYSRN